MTELVPIPRERFAVAWPGEYARAETLTEIWLRRFASRHTRASYRRDLIRWLAWCEGCYINPGQARLGHVDMWIERQRLDGAAPATIARRVSAVSSWYKYMIANTADDPMPLAVRNPTDGCAKPQIDADYSPTIGLSRAEADRLIAAADADNLTSSALIRLLLLNGLRIGSVMDARIEDLGWDSGHRTLSLVRKGGHRDRVAVPPAAGDAIDAMLAERGQQTSGHLFLTRNGRPLYISWTWRLVKRLGEMASVPQAAALTPHSLRATAITELLDAGVSLRDVQDFARHRDPRTTRRYDKQRGNLDRSGSYVLATRYGQRRDG